MTETAQIILTKAKIRITSTGIGKEVILPLLSLSSFYFFLPILLFFYHSFTYSYLLSYLVLYRGHPYKTERRIRELRTAMCTGGAARPLWLCQYTRRATMCACHQCWPRRPTTSTGRATEGPRSSVLFQIGERCIVFLIYIIFPSLSPTNRGVS